MEASPDLDLKAKRAVRDKSRAEELCKRYSTLESERSVWDSQWQEIAEKFMPRRAQITAQRDHPDSALESRIFDTSAIDSLQTMAAGLMAWTTPVSEPWFQFDPDLTLRGSDRTKRWLQDCTQLIQEYLANSNYYTERHENLLNKCCFGTGSMFAEMRGKELRFEAQQCGSYCIEEDAFGRVTSFYRKFTLDAAQAVGMFGESEVGEEVRKAAQEQKAGQAKKTFEFIHAIYPRDERDIPDTANRNAAIFMPWASCYVEAKNKIIVRESGFTSFPVMSGRYLKWQSFGVSTPWGYSPAFAALPDAKQINFLSAMVDVSVERAIDPPMLVPDELEGELIMTARGLTYVNSNVNADRWPRELYKTPELRYAEALLERKKKSIEAKFHVELFNIFAGIERQMTAREVAERAGERLTLITPAFSRDVTEEGSPLLRHVFALCAEAGMLPPPPDEAVIGRQGMMRSVPDPKVSFTSRMALAIKALRNVSADRTFERDMQIAAVRPDILDNYNFDRISRDSALNNGMPSEWLTDEDERDAMRAQRAEAAQAAQTMALAEQGAGAVQKLGGPEGMRQLMGGAA